ncbi:hypothetical protein RI129_001244 [Pyrocoelia pectoralis]|uniref:FHA domain-containing protein n=1 Tax=Pyrocoelia pectoralis TaxID=417401 RepID=A0AAN7VJC3_9COLE
MEVKKEVEDIPNSEIRDANKTTFKKPILIGKIGRLPRKMVPSKTDTLNIAVKDEEMVKSDIDVEHTEEMDSVPYLETTSKPLKSPAEQLAENAQALAYKEPSWSGLPQKFGKEYIFEVLKSGVIVEQINLMSKPFWVFGRSVHCDIYMAHPTISRFHAVLQYRLIGTEGNPPGFYIYDLNSTHGTFLNKGRLKSKVYAPVKVGHMLKLGFSTRSYVLTGPDEDTEEESALSLTELKQKRAEKLLKEELDSKQALIKEEHEKGERRKKYEERGVDWGLGEDADEETDITDNPFAQTNNEELYIDDPKKALRGFMEREGYTLDYDCTEQGFGQFLCKVELPIDDDHGHRIVAEVLHKGKKKEAVVQCALEACRILDRYGVLRQATHESRKRKARNWEENDYYDSDDDTFLDRTGSVEKKREKRMSAKIPQQPETYQSLLEKEKSMNAQIIQIERQLSAARKQGTKSETSDEDSLDLFMKGLKESKIDKQTISKLKSDLAALKSEHINIVKLVNLVKPADLPPLVPQYIQNADHTATTSVAKSKLPIFGKRKKIKVDIPQKSDSAVIDEGSDGDQIEEEDEDGTQEFHSSLDHSSELGRNQTSDIKPDPVESVEQSEIKAEVPVYIKIYRKVTELEGILHTKSFPPGVNNCISQMSEVLSDIKNVAEQSGKIQMDKNLIMAKNRKVKKHIDDLLESYDEDYLLKISKELKRLYLEIQSTAEMEDEVFSKFRILAAKINLISKEILNHINEYKEKNSKKLSELTEDCESERILNFEEDAEENGKQWSAEELEKRKRKNQKRNQHRKEKCEIEKQRGYKEDEQKEDYNMWIPPKNQTGDGRTKLNEKYGY